MESFQRAHSLPGPRPLASMLEHIRGGVVLYAIGEPPMKGSWLHTQGKDNGQHYFTLKFIHYQTRKKPVGSTKPGPMYALSILSNKCHSLIYWSPHLNFLSNNPSPHLNFLSNNPSPHLNFLSNNPSPHLNFLSNNPSPHLNFLSNNPSPQLNFLSNNSSSQQNFLLITHLSSYNSYRVPNGLHQKIGI